MWSYLSCSDRCITHASDGQLREQLADALRYQFGRLGIQLSRRQREHSVYWDSTTIAERWEGLPGYEVELQLIEVRSDRYQHVSEIGSCIRGDLIRDLQGYRARKLSQDPQFYNFVQEKFRRTSTYAAHHDDPFIKGKMLTVRYLIRSYEAGAAHGNYHYQTYSFLLDPLVLIPSLARLFTDEPAALAALQSTARQALSQVKLDYRDPEYALSPVQIERGTADWDDFRSFAFSDDGIELFFPPYQVACYADGAQSATVPYPIVAHLLREEYRGALKIGRVP